MEQFGSEFLTSGWFYLCVAVVSLVLHWFKEQDNKVHKRWYMPIALGGSFLLSVVLVGIVPEYGWSSIFLHGASIYIGQHVMGDQVLKRIEDHFKDGKA